VVVWGDIFDLLVREIAIGPASPSWPGSSDGIVTVPNRRPPRGCPDPFRGLTAIGQTLVNHRRPNAP
jgi:hypothetical protein